MMALLKSIIKFDFDTLNLLCDELAIWRWVVFVMLPYTQLFDSMIIIMVFCVESSTWLSMSVALAMCLRRVRWLFEQLF